MKKFNLNKLRKATRASIRTMEYDLRQEFPEFATFARCLLVCSEPEEIHISSKKKNSEFSKFIQYCNENALGNVYGHYFYFIEKLETINIKNHKTFVVFIKNNVSHKYYKKFINLIYKNYANL